MSDLFEMINNSQDLDSNPLFTKKYYTFKDIAKELETSRQNLLLFMKIYCHDLKPRKVSYFNGRSVYSLTKSEADALKKAYLEKHPILKRALSKSEIVSERKETPNKYASTLLELEKRIYRLENRVKELEQKELLFKEGLFQCLK